MTPLPSKRRPSGLRAVPAGVWTLGFVSLFMDVSSEMIHSLLPVFLVSGLGASVALVGLIEGMAEATASITRVFSGYLSDRFGKRKMLAVIGYGLGALTKPIFPLAVTPFEVFGARFADRIGKGIRGAPRDALVADLAPPEIRGAAFGLRQSLDTIGAFAGPLVAMGLMVLLAGDIRGVFAWAIVPALIAVALLVFGVREPESTTTQKAARSPIRWSELHTLGTPFWSVVGLGVVFTMARFSEAFLVLRAQDVGLPLALVPVVMVVMNVVYSLVAAPAGSLSDRIDRRWLLAAGLVCLIVADLLLASGSSVIVVLVGVAFWGLHMGLTQGLLATLIVDTTDTSVRGTAFGLFGLATGVTMLAASGLAGLLWSALGPGATFLAGSAFAMLCLIVLAIAARNAA